MAVLKLLYGTDVRTDILIDNSYRLATILTAESVHDKCGINQRGMEHWTGNYSYIKNIFLFIGLKNLVFLLISAG